MAILKAQIDMDKFNIMDYVYTSQTNGKTYLNFDIVERKEVGKYGDTHFIQVSKKVADGQWEKTIIGNVKTLTTNNQPQQTAQPMMPNFGNNQPTYQPQQPQQAKQLFDNTPNDLPF